MKRILGGLLQALLLVLLASAAGLAEWQGIGKVAESQVKGDQITFQTEHAVVQVSVLAPDIQDSLGVSDAVPGVKTLINLPACPVNGENIVATITRPSSRRTMRGAPSVVVASVASLSGHGP